MTDDRPIGGGGGYKINWDEIDENTNPFGLGTAFGGNKLASSSPAGRAPPIQPDPPSESDLPAPSEDPPLNPAVNGQVNEVLPEPEPPVTESGDAKNIPKKLKSNAKGLRPAPPKRTVSKGNSHEAEDKQGPAADVNGRTAPNLTSVLRKQESPKSALCSRAPTKSENQAPDVIDIPPPEEFVPEESHFSLAIHNPKCISIPPISKTTTFALVTIVAVGGMTSLSVKPPVVNHMPREHSRRGSSSSAATFDLASGNRSPLPEPEPDHHPLPVDEELVSLRADKEHLTTVVADM
ncbi:hypothetical protein ACTXT7_016603, partial [Hymenolepis weldensis]